MLSESLLLACKLASTPGFDSLFDPDPTTGLIEAYHDPIGYPTQGYGRLLSRNRWEDLSIYPAITLGEAWDRLLIDMARAARGVGRLCPVALTVGEEAALFDFTFNCGAGNLEISSLRTMVNRGDMEGAADQFEKWVYAGGQRLRGLVRRRAAERELFLSEGCEDGTTN